MGDHSTDMLLAVFFGVAGLVILVLAWLQPLNMADRAAAAVAGAAGIVLALVRAWRRPGRRGRHKRITAEISADRKH